jgi:ABC-type polysaccharide/polyol phosphate export permease
MSQEPSRLPGLVLFFAFTVSLSLVLGVLATRFRDLKPIIESTLTLAFLSSPIVWTPEMIDRNSTVMRLNPLTHLFAVWREPLASGRVAMTSVVYASACVVVLALARDVMSREAAAYWLPCFRGA